ncbi:hypothetical protein ACEPAI_5777 [Sanghuangporus weigelae]
MLKTIAASTRSLSSSVSKVAYGLGQHRRLHNLSDIPKRVPVLEDVGLNGVGHEKSKHSFKLSKAKRKDESRMLRDRTRISPDGPAASPKSLKKMKRARLKRSGKFKDPLAAQSTIRPAVQAARVKEIFEAKGVEEAISFVTTAPIDTLNSIVWNTLLAMLMRAGMRKQAYDMFIEMKRRGFSPSARTFRTMMSGMDEIAFDEWPQNSLNLQRCHKLYEAIEEYSQSCTESHLKDELLFLRHARGHYVRILGKTGNFRKIADIYYKSGEVGALPRDRELYGALFGALMARKEADQVGNLSVAEQNASDAKFYWKTLEKDMERGLEVDSYAITPFLKIMAGGRPTDQQFGLNVVRDIYGLAPPGEAPPPPRYQLCSRSFQAVLELCNRAKKFRLCTYFLKQVTEQSRQKSNKVSSVVIGYRHINEQLIALGQLAAVGSFDESETAVDAIRYLRLAAALEVQENGKVGDFSLTRETVALALGVCWRCGDWERATMIFSLVTDLSPEMFLDDGPFTSGSIDAARYPHHQKKLIYMTASTHMARTALSTGDKSKMRQCLRMMWYYGTEPSHFETHPDFYKYELAKATIKLVDAAAADWSKDEVKIWKDMKKESRAILQKQSPVERPEKEEGGLGSEKYLGKLQQAIDFELSAR